MHTSIRVRLLAAFLAVALFAAAGLSAYFLSELEAYGLRKLEERLHTQSLMVSAAIAASLSANDASRLTSTEAKALAEKIAAAGPGITSRVRVLDSDGEAVVDSADEDGVGVGYTETPEVAAALRGEYGPTRRMTQEGRIALFVATPIVVEDRIVGATYVSASTFSIRTLLRDYRLRLGAVVLLFVVIALVFTELLARWLSAPMRDLAETAAAFAAGDHAARARPRGSRETRAVAEAFNAMADEVQTALAELKEEEKRKTRFVSDVSHELRTPLTAIRGAAETLLDGDVPEDDARQFLTTIARESERLTRLANDLLTLQRIEGATGELPLRRADLRQIAALAIEALEPLAAERGVHVTLEGSAPAVLGDRDRLQQVIANLVDNATRMTPKGGEVRVRLRADDTWSVVTVADEGPGIRAEDLPRLFDRFYRSEQSRTRATGGAGLGLAIVKAIVTAHGGSIEAANPPEGGAEFSVRLPAMRETPAG